MPCGPFFTHACAPKVHAVTLCLPTGKPDVRDRSVYKARLRSRRPKSPHRLLVEFLSRLLRAPPKSTANIPLSPGRANLQKLRPSPRKDLGAAPKSHMPDFAGLPVRRHFPAGCRQRLAIRANGTSVAAAQSSNTSSLGHRNRLRPPPPAAPSAAACNDDARSSVARQREVPCRYVPSTGVSTSARRSRAMKPLRNWEKPRPT